MRTQAHWVREALRSEHILLEREKNNYIRLNTDTQVYDETDRARECDTSIRCQLQKQQHQVKPFAARRTPAIRAPSHHIDQIEENHFICSRRN
jgi:hypothetical protein